MVNTFLHDLSLIITAAAIIGNLALGIFVLLHNPKNKTNQIYFVFILFLITWMGSSYILDENVKELVQIFLLRITFASGALAAYSFYLFSNFFPISKRFSLSQKILAVITLFLVILSIFTNSIVIPLQSIPGAFYFHDGLLYPLYTAILLFLLLRSVITFFYNFQRSKGQQRLQLAYILLGMFVPVIFIMVFTLIIPMLNPNMDKVEFMTRVILHRVSLVSTLLYTIATSYAIIRHRLFGIRVILGELLFWLVGSTLTFVFFYGTILFESRLFDSLTSPIAIFLNIILALVVFPTLRATNNWLRHTIRKISINVSFDHEHVLKEYNQEITQCHTTTEIIASLFKFVIEIYSPKFIGIVLIEHLTSNITAEWKGLTPEQLINVENEEVITELFNENSQKIKELLPNFELQMPIELTGYLGVLVLGTRKDHSAYAIEDIQFLERVLEFTTLNLPRTLK